MLKSTNGLLEQRALGCLAFGVIGDAIGTPTENLEPEAIEQKFGWVERFEGDGTDDSIMRDLIAAALVATGGYADADSWAYQWQAQQSAIFGEKVGRFFPSVLHAAAKLRFGYLPRMIANGTMPSSSSAMAIAPVGIVNAGNPRAAAAQAQEIASLIHVTDVAFCQDGAAAIAAAVAAALSRDATIDSVVQAALDHIKPWSGGEMKALIEEALRIAKSSADYKEFRKAYHQKFRRNIACDSRETVPATLAIAWLAKGDPWQAAVFGANFGRDSDTIGCMAAGICGALSGISPANEIYLKQLPQHSIEAQIRLAAQLVEVKRLKTETEARALNNSI